MARELPYPVVFDVCTTRIEKLVAIEGTARGDFEGMGRRRFSRKGLVCSVHYERHVCSTLWWMNLCTACQLDFHSQPHSGHYAGRRKAGPTACVIRFAPRKHRFDGTTQSTAGSAPTPAGAWIDKPNIVAGCLSRRWCRRHRGAVRALVTSVPPILETLFRDGRLTAALVATDID